MALAGCSPQELLLRPTNVILNRGPTFGPNGVNIAMSPSPDTHHLYEVLSPILSLSTIWKLLFVLLILGNLKNVPFVWHLRLLNAFRFVLRSQRPKNEPTPAQLFQPLITTSHGPLMEIDFNLHKTNSSYFSDLDIARTHLICTLFSTGIESARGGTEAITRGRNPTFGVALGAVSCSFKRELKPYEQYEMWTRVLSWDRKWLYIVTHFVRKDAASPREYTLYPGQKSRESSPKRRNSGEAHPQSSAIYASALSKCVFKLSRITIAPEVMVQASGLLPSKPTDMTPFRREQSPEPVMQMVADEVSDVPFKSESTGRKVDLADLPQKESTDEWTCEKIESERRRGMEMAKLLAGQDKLEDEFTADSEALGRQSDGTGVSGVVSTLCQIAHLSKAQFL